MKDKFKIKVGQELPAINRAGTYILFFGVLLFLVTGIVLFAGTYLPLELKLIYFVEVISQNVYLTFLASILLFLLGSKIMDLKKFNETDLIISDDGLDFYQGQKRIQLPNEKIHKLIKTKSFFTPDKKLTIKTIGLKKYEIKLVERNYKKLLELFPNRT